jgi:hypothetical protein
VEWIEGDFYDLSLWQGLPRFDEVVSNPPFGAVVTNCDPTWLGYRGPAGLMAAAVALRVARLGVHLILPQNQTIFRYSGPRFPGQSVYADLPLYKDEWRGASPLVEAFTLCNREPELIPLPAAVSPPPAARPDCRLIMTG